MAEGPVPADPGDAGRERLGQQQVMEELPAVVAQPVDRGALVAAVEGAEEIAPVPPVEDEQATAPPAPGRPRRRPARPAGRCREASQA